jgi:hypothetical protein
VTGSTAKGRQEWSRSDAQEAGKVENSKQMQNPEAESPETEEGLKPYTTQSSPEKVYSGAQVGRS